MITIIILCGAVYAGAAYLSEKSINPDTPAFDALKRGSTRIYDTLILEIEKLGKKDTPKEEESTKQEEEQPKDEDSKDS